MGLMASMLIFGEALDAGLPKNKKRTRGVLEFHDSKRATANRRLDLRVPEIAFLDQNYLGRRSAFARKVYEVRIGGQNNKAVLAGILPDPEIGRKPRKTSFKNVHGTWEKSR